MVYSNIVEGEFLNRPNRFIAEVLINGKKEIVHVKNTGRCKELLIKGSRVFLYISDNPLRKTKYDLIGVLKDRVGKAPLYINMDSQAPNDAVAEWLKKGELFLKEAVIKREVKYKNSRFDFYIEDGSRRTFLEVKGVTLEENGIAMFPDAPTERGIKHINELIECRKDGFEAYIIFVIQMKEIKAFKPNDKTHKAFGDALRKALKSGVKILAYDCNITRDSISVGSLVQIIL